MRSVLVREQGGPEVIEVVDGPAPEPGPGEVRVEVGAAGVNFRDLQQRSGGYPARTPFVLGAEGAGTVTALGRDVSDLRVGDRIAWAMVDGAGYTEQAVVPAHRAVPVPDDVDDETAAAVLLQGLTAHYLTRSTYAVRTGDDVLVHAAAGGTGALLVQFAARAGARVIATVSTPEKGALAREAGATDVLLSGDDTLVDDVRELTGGAGVHVVYDGVGRDTFEASRRSLRRRGMLVLFGLASGPVAPIDPSILGRGSLFLTRPGLIDHIATREELLARAADVFGRVARGELTVRIGGRYPLAEARRAHEDLASRRTTGKLLVVPGS